MTIYSVMGNLSRSMSELGLTTVEQQRMLRNNNILTSTFMSEKDARAGERDDTQLKLADLSFKKYGAKQSRKAADLAFIGAILNLAGTALKIGISSGSSEGTQWSKAIPDLVNGFGAVASKYLDKMKAKAEEDAVQEDLQRLNGEKAQIDAGVAALDANPYG